MEQVKICIKLKIRIEYAIHESTTVKLQYILDIGMTIKIQYHNMSRVVTSLGSTRRVNSYIIHNTFCIPVSYSNICHYNSLFLCLFTNKNYLIQAPIA
jgi:hypothetical protein